MYIVTVGIPPLAMVDDLVAIANCGVDSLAMNSFLNSKFYVKKLQFGTKNATKYM